MRIMRRFTIPDILRTAPGTTYKFVHQQLADLARHGIVARNTGYSGGRVGEFQVWRLVRELGPEYPLVCDLCGEAVSFKACNPKPKKTKREKQRQTHTDTVTEAPRPEPLPPPDPALWHKVPDEVKERLEAQHNDAA